MRRLSKLAVVAGLIAIAAGRSGRAEDDQGASREPVPLRIGVGKPGLSSSDLLCPVDEKRLGSCNKSESGVTVQLMTPPSPVGPLGSAVIRPPVEPMQAFSFASDRNVGTSLAADVNLSEWLQRATAARAVPALSASAAPLAFALPMDQSGKSGTTFAAPLPPLSLRSDN